MKKHILVINSTLGGWGAERNLRLLGEYLDKNKFEISYLLTLQQPNKDFFQDSRVRVSPLCVRQIRQNRYTWAANLLLRLYGLFQWLKRLPRAPDYIVVTALEEVLISFACIKILKLKTKLVVFNQLMISEVFRASDWFTKLHLRMFLLVNRRCDFLLCLSQGIADDLHLNYGVQKPIYVHPGCIDCKKLQTLASESIEEEWLLSDSRKTILHVGRLVNRQKRTDLLIKGFHRLLLNRPDFNVKLVIIGEGQDKQHLEKLVDDLGINESVYFLPYKENPHKYYRLGYCFVLTSDFEGFANVLIEAMAAGLPVIATDCPSGPAEILDNGRYGILIPKDDELSLATEIQKLLEDQEIAREYRKKSLERMADYQCSRVFEKLNQVFLSH